MLFRSSAAEYGKLVIIHFAYIVAVNKNFSACGTVTTTEAPKKTVKPAKVKIQAATKKIAPGKKLTLKATVTPKKATNKKVKWTIRKSDKKYASINSKGVLTVKKTAKGKTIKVTATAVGNSKVKATYTVKVMKKAVKKVTITSKKKYDGVLRLYEDASQCFAVERIEVGEHRQALRHGFPADS